MGKLPAGFRPWREDFVAAGAFVVLAATAIVMAFGAVTKSPVAALAELVACAACLYAARWAWRNGMRRWHGKHLEGWAVERLGLRMAQYGIRSVAGLRVPGHGDADFIAYTTSGPVLIEIKSYESWRAGEREAAAAVQVDRLAVAVGAAAAYVWLPRGRPTFFQRLSRPTAGGAVVILGGERDMVAAIRKHQPRMASLVEQWHQLRDAATRAQSGEASVQRPIAARSRRRQRRK